MRRDDYEACIVSHYIARLQETTEEKLHWNQESLKYADAVNDERVKTFYPSLFLNVGKAYEDVGNKQEARKYYQLAADSLHTLPDGRYGDIVRDGIAAGLRRVP